MLVTLTLPIQAEIDRIPHDLFAFKRLPSSSPNFVPYGGEEVMKRVRSNDFPKDEYEINCLQILFPHK